MDQQKVFIVVAKAFIPNLDKKRTVDHIDNDITINCLYNLRWTRNKGLKTTNA